MVQLLRKALSLLASALFLTILTCLILLHRTTSRSYETLDSFQNVGGRLTNWAHYTDTHTLSTSTSTYQTKTNHSRYAYVQYATNSIYLCNALMLFESLHRLGSTANRLLLYPSYMTDSIGEVGSKEAGEVTSDDGSILRRARDLYGVKLKGVEVISKDGMGVTRWLILSGLERLMGLTTGAAELTWAESYTKLLAFNQTQYERVLALDSDATLLKVFMP